MLLVRAPLRINFIGDSRPAGRVISATINKFIYLAIKPTQLVNKFIVKYQTVESVAHPKELAHDRVRAALMDLGLTKQGIEIASFADIPAKTGLGSSSSFSVALMRGLYSYMGKPMSKAEAANAAARLEIELLNESVGKEDHYAAAFGGFNMFEFRKDGRVGVEPVLLDFKQRAALQNHLLLFYTGIARVTGKTAKRRVGAKKISLGAVADFREALLAGDIRGMAALLSGAGIAGGAASALYDVGIAAGAWGGKMLGACSGCVLFFAPPKAHAAVRRALARAAAEHKLADFIEIPFAFTQSGTDLLFNAREM